MFRPATALACAALTLTASLAAAEPILKPHKYYGPIPQSALTLRFGMLGGASNEEMLLYLESKVDPPFESTSEDFGNSPSVELGYMRKPHPRFGVRLNAGYSAAKAKHGRTYIPTTFAPPDTVPPVLQISREFKVDLFVLEASAVYYFADASVKEFQTYLGGGFSLGFPHQTYKETRVRQETGEPYGDEFNRSEWDVSPGVHAVLGAIYYASNRFGISAEGRVQLLQSTFDQLELPDGGGKPVSAHFVADYTGFVLTVGALWAF